MADNIELAHAYVTIVPSMRGAQQTIAEELGAASESAGESSGSSFGSSFGSALKKVGGGFMSAVGSIASATMSAVTATAQGVTNLVTQSVNSYAEFEQLSGGIERLYGDAADAVMEHAQDAFETAGMNANSYMQSVTSFSAALLNSLEGDTQAAADVADMIMRDVSDNASTFGTMSAEELTNVYTALAKGQFTLLDNLNLGYAGSQSGMIDLINASGIFEEGISSLDGVTFDQMAQAIHNVQEQMSITGTTANEAAGTVQGSLNMMQGAWENLLIGLGDPNAELEPLIDNLISSAESVVRNIAPVVSRALQGIGQAIQAAAPIIAEQLPVIMDEVVPSVLESLLMLINAATESLPGLLQAVLPPLLETVTNITITLLGELPNILQILSAQLPFIIGQVIPSLLEVLPSLIETGIQFVLAIAQGLADNINLLMDSVLALVHYLVDELLSPDNISNFITTATQIVLTIAQALIENAPELMGAVVVLVANIISALVDALPGISLQVVDFIVGLGNDLGGWLYDMFGDTIVVIGDNLANIWDTIVSWADDLLSNALSWGADLVGNLVDGITSGMSSLTSAASGIADGIASYIHFTTPDVGPLADADEYMPDFVDLLVEGLESGTPELEAAMNNTLSVVAPSDGDLEFSNYSPASGAGGDLIIPVSIGGEVLDTIILKSEQISTFRRGG